MDLTILLMCMFVAAAVGLLVGYAIGQFLTRQEYEKTKPVKEQGVNPAAQRTGTSLADKERADDISRQINELDAQVRKCVRLLYDLKDELAQIKSGASRASTSHLLASGGAGQATGRLPEYDAHDLQDAIKDVLRAPQPDTSSSGIRNRLRETGERVTKALFNQADFREFSAENKLLQIEMRDNGVLAILDKKHATATNQWFFAIHDEASGLWGMYFGARVHNSAETIRKHPEHTIEGFQRWFHVERRHNVPELIEPAIVEERNGQLVLRFQGSMTI